MKWRNVLAITPYECESSGGTNNNFFGGIIMHTRERSKQGKASKK